MDTGQVSTYSRLVSLLSGQLSLSQEKISRDSFLKDDLGADSLDTAEIVMMIKDEFGYDLSDEEISTIKQVRDLEELLNQHVKHNPST